MRNINRCNMKVMITVIPSSYYTSGVLRWVTGSSSFVRLGTQDMFYCLDIAHGKDVSRMKFSFSFMAK